jgi:hypothetical protein
VPAVRGIRLTGPPPPARVLVCAQSNAAIDEIVARLAAQGVWRPGGAREAPGMVRGSGDAKHWRSPSLLPPLQFCSYLGC